MGDAGEELFAGRPATLRLYRAIHARVTGLGPVEVAATRSQVSFGSERKFAWVWLPGRWTTNRPPDSVVLTFALDRRIDDPCIAEAVEPRPGHWTHHVVVEDEAQLDASVDAWLAEAYALASAPRRPPEP